MSESGVTVDWVEDRCLAVLCGAAVGDALGGATEGWTPEQIEQRYDGRVTGIVGPYYEDWRHARPIAPYHKGDGHVTDDTLMNRALIDVYCSRQTHLDAYALAEELVPRMISQQVWIPELETDGLLLQRVFLAEKWLVARLHYGHVDPREAGVGNLVNCGAAMYAMPVGLANMGAPQAAYAEAIDMFGTHQSSYGREAAGIVAACVAESTRPGATVASVLQVATNLSHDGTHDAIVAVVAAGQAHGIPASPDAERTLARALRDAVRPYDLVGDDYRNQSLDARRPSRTKSIEELPIALGFLAAHCGDYTGAVLGAVNYGRDADSIAEMAGSIAAGLGGFACVPHDWLTQIEAASKMSLTEPARRMADVVRTLLDAEMQTMAARGQVITQLRNKEHAA
jgi:ADP-ribosylglycohydrolase